MAKIRLDLDTLRIESFDTIAPSADERGTVQAFDSSDRESICQESCAGTCYTHCWGACDAGDTYHHGATVTACSQIIDCDNHGYGG
ncbi:MAG TPA: hypothetical protein VGB15_11055 [Longimicrobium sp.]|jgi:hypothetical protein